MMIREFDLIIEKFIYLDSFGVGEKCLCLLVICMIVMYKFDFCNVILRICFYWLKKVKIKI